MSDETTPGPDLRERIAKALTAEHYRRDEARIAASPEEHSAAMADAVMAVVKVELDQRETGRLKHAAEVELVLADLRQRTEAAETEADRLRGWDESLSGRLTKELADAKARAEQAEAELAKQRERDDRMTEMVADHVNTMAEDLRAQEAWARQLYAAWWSARIGRARTRKALDVVADADIKHQFQRDQLKATIDRAKALATNAERTGCGAGWDLNPADVLAMLQPKEGT